MAFEGTQKDVVRLRIKALLAKREWPKTICPSEVARALSQEELEIVDALNWRDAMQPVREIIWQLRENGEVEVLQKGQVIDATALEDVHGPIRIRNIEK